MPVVVTGGDAPMGRAVLAALRAEGVPDLRATVATRAAQRELVAAGVRTALVDWSAVDLERLGGVLTGAHTVVHLAAAPLAVVEAAAEGTGVQRVVLVADGPAPASVLDVVVVPPGDAAVAGVLAADRAR